MSTPYTIISYLLSLSLLLLLTTAQEDGIRKLKLLGDYTDTPVDFSAMKETISSLDDDLATYQKRTCQFGLNSHHCALADLDRVMSSSEWLNSGHSPGKRSLQIKDPNLIRKYERCCFAKKQKKAAHEIPCLTLPINVVDDKNAFVCCRSDCRLKGSNRVTLSHQTRGSDITEPRQRENNRQTFLKVLEDISRKRQSLASLNTLLQRMDYHLTNKQKRTCLLELGGQCRTELASAIADQYYYLNSPSSPGKRRRRRRRSVPAASLRTFR